MVALFLTLGAVGVGGYLTLKADGFAHAICIGTLVGVAYGSLIAVIALTERVKVLEALIK